MGSQIGPLIAGLQQMKDVVLVVKDETFVIHFFNLDKSAHRQVHQGRRDVAGMNRIFQQRSGLSGRYARRRLVHGGD